MSYRLSRICLLVFVSVVVLVSCTKEYSLEAGQALSLATGTLKDSSGNCLESKVYGTYYNGVPTNSDTNFIQVQVNVATAGSYSITTITQNGFAFKDSGYFTTPGLNIVRLRASGTPVSHTETIFSITFNNTTCSFSVPVNDSTGSGLGTPTPSYASDTAWHFTEGSQIYHGSIDTAFTYDTTIGSSTARILEIQGSTAAAHDSVFLVGVTFGGGTIQVGTFPTTLNAGFKFLGSYNLDDTVYSATYQIPTVSSNITISSYDQTTQIIKGTLSGTALNKAGEIVTITNGKFEAKLH